MCIAPSHWIVDFLHNIMYMEQLWAYTDRFNNTLSNTLYYWMIFQDSGELSG